MYDCGSFFTAIDVGACQGASTFDLLIFKTLYNGTLV
ncbi:hypothetical protein JOC33_003998 [Thalassobacillus pellis]|nr:hypothetical protein [Thalassobacillus pellis]